MLNRTVSSADLFALGALGYWVPKRFQNTRIEPLKVDKYLRGLCRTESASVTRLDPA